MSEHTFPVIQKYVEKTGVAQVSRELSNFSASQVIFSLVQQIFERDQLPYDPFGLFDGPLRSHAEHLDLCISAVGMAMPLP
jgi:hypothetical protein